MRLRPCFPLLIFALCLTAAKAEAHAIILASTPTAGATVATGPVSLTLRFNSRIDHARSVLTLYDTDNHQAKLPILPESATDTLLATTESLAAGAYRVRWQVLSVDGHITRGDIPFTVQ